VNKKEPSIIGEISNEFEKLRKHRHQELGEGCLLGKKILRRKSRDIVPLTLWNFSKNPAAVSPFPQKSPLSGGLQRDVVYLG
jgi:hypothetical protein